MDYIYIEYSGVYGDRELVKEALEAVNHARIIYGGGIVSKETAKKMDSVSDIMVVGNIIYDDAEQALETII